MSSLMLRANMVVRKLTILLIEGFLLSFFKPHINGNRVLIVKVDAIGDFVIWLDAARTLVRHYHSQGYSVVLLGNHAWASWAKEMGVADEVWGIEVNRFAKNFFYRWEWIKKIRKAGFKIAIQPTHSRLILEGDSMVRASGAAERIGSEGDESNMRLVFKLWSNGWFTRLIPASRMPLMELKRNAEFMRGLGIVEFKSRVPTITPSLAGGTVDLPTKPYVVLFSGASWRGKAWTSDKFAEIGYRLIARGLHIVLAGGKSDREYGDELVKRLQGNALDLVGKTSLSELAEVLRGADVVITNDTSAVHISIAVDAPVVCILGGGHFGRFVPYEIEVSDESRPLPILVTKPMACFGCNWQCIYPRQNDEAVKCIQDISVDMVWEAVEVQLAKHGNKKLA